MTARKNLFATQSLTKASYDAAKEQLDKATAKVQTAARRWAVIEAKADAQKRISMSFRPGRAERRLWCRKREFRFRTPREVTAQWVVLKIDRERDAVLAGTTGSSSPTRRRLKRSSASRTLAVPEMKLAGL
jgi:hypothetical protein